MRRALLALVAALAVALVLVPARPAAAKSFSIASLTSNAQLLADGSMDVDERVVYDFADGPFTVGIRTFSPRSTAQIVGFEAYEGERRLTVTPPGSSISGGWEWEFAPAYNQRRTFELRYRVARAATIGSDVGELYWQFVGTDHPGIGQVDVRIALPGGFPVATPTTPDSDAGVVRGWAHGPSNGVIDVAGDQVDLNVSGVPEATFVEARVVVPSAAFTVPPTTGPRLETVLREEQDYIEREDRDRRLARIATWLVPVVLGGVALGFFVVWRVWGKEPRAPDLGDYWREPLDDPPAVVAANLEFGTVNGGAFAATVVDLAQRGVLTIQEIEPRKYAFHWTGTGKGARTPHEDALLQHLFRGRTEATSDDFSSWAKGSPGTAQAFWNSWKNLVKDDVDARGYIERGRVAPWVWFWALVVGLAVSGFVLAAMGGSFSWLCFVALVPLLLCGQLLRRRTPKGAAKAEEAKALKRFLEDFSSLDEAPVASLAIWERYLVAAVTLGVAGELVQGLAMKVPAVAQDPSFAAWYIGVNGRRGFAGLDGIQRFTGSFGSTATSSLAPSKSGSGGGFSGGGGGGGGGGGFGAR